MGNNTPARSSQQFPFVPVVTLFSFIAITLIVLLQSQASLMPSLVRPTVTTRPTQTLIVPTEIPTIAPTVAVSAALAVSYDPAQVTAGERVIIATCSACHGMNAMGIQGLGKSLLDSEFIDGMSDAEVIAFIQVGRQAFDPLNSTGVAMPANGGNPGLTETDLANVVAYLRVHALYPERILAGDAAGGAIVPVAETTAEATAEVPAGTPTPYVLPIDRFNLGGAAATPQATATTYVLPINRFNIPTATPSP